MDDLDLAIVRALAHPETLQWNARLSYAEAARLVGADEETVRLRVLRMQERGVIAGWEIAVHPALLGRELVRYDLPPTEPGSREKLAGALEAMDGARLIFEYYGGRFGLVAYRPTGVAGARQGALLAAIAGGPPRERVLSLPPPSVALTPLDWRLVQALRRDPRAPHAELAGAAGVSERTVRRRLDRMTDGRALFLDPVIDMSRMSGVLACTVWVVHGPGSPRRALDEALRALPGIVFAWSEGDEARVSFHVDSVPALERVRRSLEALAAGQAKVAIELTLARRSLRGWLDEEVARRAAAP